MYRYICMYIWSHTLQSHRIGVEPIHVQCCTQKSIAVALCEKYDLHPHNPLHAIKKPQSHLQKTAPCERALTAYHFSEKVHYSLEKNYCVTTKIMKRCELQICFWGWVSWIYHWTQLASEQENYLIIH